mmetsp:Transcript_43733/g.139411  ORF Transcript_43733/g.139411 Transcript_43733/m.139411 type:complete len:118 (+) Transcript_43733:96-449(+)
MGKGRRRRDRLKADAATRSMDVEGPGGGGGGPAGMDTTDGAAEDVKVSQVWNSVTGTWVDPTKVKARPGPRGANTKIQKKRKGFKLERAVAIAERFETKNNKFKVKTLKKKGLKELY